MIGMIVKLVVKEDCYTGFEHAFAAQAAAVRSNEPGNRVYELFRSRTRPLTYTLVEIYDDEVALAAHRASPHMAVHRPLTAPFVAGQPEIATFDVLSHVA
ncbi:antibiotic biosynthesis monooxygenase protein (plasmid) [Rhizobium phaseoli]|uniref:putative quinol monooxygenase n=1 Tax=Rhizobium phaseoli TaxID=396 RepID=UPI0007EC057E|nr:putative quinol monooxygenase [Rhizobium phaseoli]ANL50999.1 antibiotic biosynthesis monooxygenase protein [Rhizobium phaseoli]